MTSIADAAPDTANASRAQRWVVVQPALGRVGHPGAGPEVVARWLHAASAGSAHAADRALQAMGRLQWSLAANADHSFVLQAGDARWQLVPHPTARPLVWHVRRQST